MPTILQYLLKKSLLVWNRIQIIWGFFPATLTGLAVLALCAGGFWYVGILHKDVILLPATIGIAVVVLLMMLAVGVGGLIVRKRWSSLSGDQAVVRLVVDIPRETDIKLSIPFIPFIEVSWQWTTPEKIDATTQYGWKGVAETALAKRRCLYDGITRSLKIADVLGMASIKWQAAAPTKVYALPAEGPLSDQRILASLSGGEDLSDPYGDPQGDLIEMRQYVPGDSARAIIWKVYARNRRVMVRMPEKALTAKPRTCAYMVSGAGDEASASIARTILQQNLLGTGWCFGADGTPGCAKNLTSALECLSRSGNPDLPPTGLMSFLRESEAQGFQSCLIFIPSTVGPWLKQVQSAVKQQRMKITWILGMSKPITSLDKQKLWTRLVYMPFDENSYDPTEVIRTLHSASTPVIVYDKTTGNVIRDTLAWLKHQENKRVAQ